MFWFRVYNYVFEHQNIRVMIEKRIFVPSICASCAASRLTLGVESLVKELE